MQFIPYIEMWLEPCASSPAIHVSFDPGEQVKGSPVLGRERFYCTVKGGDGRPVWLCMVFVAQIKGQSVFEALPALPVPIQFPDLSTSWQLIWSPLLAKT